MDDLFPVDATPDAASDAAEVFEAGGRDAFLPILDGMGRRKDGEKRETEKEN